MRLLDKVLRRNTSSGRVIGFVLSNFIGLVIVLGGLTFYFDARGIWEESGSFVSTDYLVVNKKVTGSVTIGDNSTEFTPEEIASLKRQPWVRSVGEFSSTDYQVYASVGNGGRGMSTYMFFESIPDEFIDVPSSQWHYKAGDRQVPIIISKDYLTLYNFGFAASAGLPRMSESFMGSIPLRLRLSSDDGSRGGEYEGRIVGYSNRLNTILVPEEFMRTTNASYGNGGNHAPSRLIVDVSSPGDVAISGYMDSHDLEVAGDKSGSSASFLLKVVTGIVLVVGIVITLLSLSILLLSISLILEKNREKLHGLLMLGYDIRRVTSHYRWLVIIASVVALLMSWCAVWILRIYYMTPLEGLGATGGGLWVAPVVGVGLTAIVILVNIISIHRKARASWRVRR